MTIENSTIAGNGAVTGGGIGNSERGTLTVLDSTIADNFTSGSYAGVTVGLLGGDGGGIDNAGSLTVVDSTIAYNQALNPGGGGGLYDEAGSTTTLDNTIVALNTDSGGADDIAGLALFPTSGYNLVGIDETGSLTNGVNGNLVGVTNPGLGPLTDNGGPTETMALLPGSPAIDAGSNALVAIDPATGPPIGTDQRGALWVRRGSMPAPRWTSAPTRPARPTWSTRRPS